MITNLVESVLDRKKLKWDAFWHLFAWLLDANEGHNLGSTVMQSLCLSTFGEHFPSCQLHLELQLSNIKDGKGKWPDLVVAIPSFDNPSHVIVMDDVDSRSPGSRRKLLNLIAYQDLARVRFPSAIIRAVVLTNAQNGESMSKTYEALKEEAADFKVSVGWKLLPICRVGDWVETSLRSPESQIDQKIQLFLDDFVTWSRSLHS